MTTSKLKIDGMTCGGCVAHVTRALTDVEGVTTARVDLATGRAEVDQEVVDVERLKSAVSAAGYTATEI